MLAQGAARFSHLDFTRGETPKLLEMARSPASALPARPSVLHRCTSSRRCGNSARTRSRRQGGRRTPRRVRTLLDRRGHAGCRRPGSRRCCSPSHPGPWAQASFLSAGAGEGSLSNDVSHCRRMRVLFSAATAPSRNRKPPFLAAFPVGGTGLEAACKSGGRGRLVRHRSGTALHVSHDSRWIRCRPAWVPVSRVTLRCRA